jgi:spore maturation protein CgeB
MTKLKEGKIVLGLLCKIHPDQTTTRTFEIPASGSFLLAERTEEHESLFEDEKEAIFFNSLEDLKHKVKYYLENNFERESIAKNGHEKIKNANYSNKNRILEIFHKIAEV